MWNENQNLRWIVVDEVSTASAEILNILESNVRTSTREQNASASYKLRPDGVERPFGGVNLCLFGDWWQLPPVQQTPLFTNPYGKHEHGVQRALAMFWSRSEDSLTLVRELTREQRCKDPWLSIFLKGCRDGSQSWSMYNFVHGYPTYEVGSYMEDTKRPSCGNAHCVELMDDLWPRMKKQGGHTWSDMRSLECDTCKGERCRRRRVMQSNDDRHRSEPFVSAPYIHAMNWPKYHALTLRAVGFARASSKRLLWVIALDRPITKDDKPMSPEAFQHRREQWLQLHDQKTNGIMGLLPLVRDMPVRFTETTDKDKQIFKNSRGKLVGWHLEQVDEERLRGQSGVQEGLSIMPKHLLVRIPGA